MSFHENEHPRDKDGKFTDGAGEGSDAKIRRVEKKHFIRLTKEEFRRIMDEVPGEAFGFASKERLHTKDHLQHAKEMGLTPAQYEKAAIAFWNSKQGKMFYSCRRGRYCRYDEKTERMLVVGKDGTVHTFYILPKNYFTNHTKQEEYICLEE